MRIAQIAPLTEAVPPKLYGGTEQVIHWLTRSWSRSVTMYAVRERGFADVGQARSRMAARVAP